MRTLAARGLGPAAHASRYGVMFGDGKRGVCFQLALGGGTLSCYGVWLPGSPSPRPTRTLVTRAVPTADAARDALRDATRASTIPNSPRSPSVNRRRNRGVLHRREANRYTGWMRHLLL